MSEGNLHPPQDGTCEGEGWIAGRVGLPASPKSRPKPSKSGMAWGWAYGYCPGAIDSPYVSGGK